MLSAVVARATGGLREGGLRLRHWDKLSDDEEVELLKLVEAATEGGGFNLARLGEKDAKRCEALIERGSDEEKVFERAREDAKLRQELGEIVRNTRTPKQRVKLEESGSVTLRKQWVYDFVRDRVLWPSHIGLLVYIIACFENGGPPIPTPGVTFTGDELIVDVQQAKIPPDPGGSYFGWQKLLTHLETNKFVTIDRRGREWHIALGSRLVKSTERAAA